MKELNDNEFDSIFRKKVLEAELQFEEEAWNRMNKKLSRRTRVLFFKKAAFVACTLLFLGIAAHYLMGPEQIEMHHLMGPEQIEMHPNVTQTKKPTGPISPKPRKPAHISPKTFAVTNKTSPANSTSQTEIIQTEIAQAAIEDRTLQVKELMLYTDTAVRRLAAAGPVRSLAGNKVADTEPNESHPKPFGKRLPLSLSVQVGPEFNSVAGLLGGKAGFGAGVILNLGLTKKLSLQAGARYSIKEYHADGFTYQFSNAAVKGRIADIDASCTVIEIPLLASYTIADNLHRSIDLNAGISSYLMLTEDYLFKYTPESGIADRLSHRSNENQHFLGIVDLSLTYYLKMKSEKLQFGIEPFVKIPLTGVGAGKVNLKSNGISFKLRYDLQK